MRIKWIDVENGSQINYEELDFPVNETLTIHEARREDEYSKWLYPGDRTYRFSYKLAPELPYSLDGKYGTIGYKAKAVVMIANGKTSESMEQGRRWPDCYWAECQNIISSLLHSIHIHT